MTEDQAREKGYETAVDLFVRQGNFGLATDCFRHMPVEWRNLDSSETDKLALRRAYITGWKAAKEENHG